MAEWSKALRSGRSPLLWAWVRIPLLTKPFWFVLAAAIYCSCPVDNFHPGWPDSRVAQWKRAGPITQRSVDRNYALLTFWLWLRFLNWICYKVAWPSGLRRWFKAPVSSEAWVRIPPLPKCFLTNFSKCLGDTRIWTMDLSDCSRLLYHWAISPTLGTPVLRCDQDNVNTYRQSTLVAISANISNGIG